MKLYHNLFAYLNGDIPLTETVVIHGSDRPILVLDNYESISPNPLLIPHGDRIYEIGFPYLKPSDLQHHDNSLCFQLILAIDEVHYPLQITDEVLDEGAIEEENSEWNNVLDNSVALLLQNFTGLLSEKKFWCDRHGDFAKLYLHQFPEHLSQFNVADATLPLVVSLDKQYQLTRKLREITPKLRHQLRRQAELMPIGRIQEMDSNCLRDYTRRPGRSPEEKGGSRQELMGVRRDRDYNTLENKFIVYFTEKVLHLECFRYENSDSSAYLEPIRKLRKTIEFFKQSSTVTTIHSRYFQLTKPNYVLQQNPIYSSFYRAYLNYISKRSEKEKIWSYRTKLLGDIVYLCLTTALLRFNGVRLKPLASLTIRTSPDRGSYLVNEQDRSISIPIFLQQSVYEFRLEKNVDLSLGDYRLIIESHDLTSSSLTTKKKEFLFWIFWYEPRDEIINQARQYINKTANHSGIVIYLQTSPNKSSPNCQLIKASERLLLCQIANPIVTQSFTPIVEFFGNKLIKYLAEIV